MAVPPNPAETAAADAAKRNAEADAARRAGDEPTSGQRPTGPGQMSTASPRLPDPEEASPRLLPAGTDRPPLVVEPPDPRIREAMIESRKQAREAHIASHKPDDGLPDERIREPMKGPHDEVKDLLGDTAKPSGHMRMAEGGGAKRLQAEWVAGDKAAWFDVPGVTVDSLPDPQPPSPDVWPGVPGSRPKP